MVARRETTAEAAARHLARWREGAEADGPGLSVFVPWQGRPDVPRYVFNPGVSGRWYGLAIDPRSGALRGPWIPTDARPGAGARRLAREIRRAVEWREADEIGRWEAGPEAEPA